MNIKKYFYKKFWRKKSYMERLEAAVDESKEETAKRLITMNMWEFTHIHDKNDMDFCIYFYYMLVEIFKKVFKEADNIKDAEEFIFNAFSKAKSFSIKKTKHKVIIKKNGDT